jgi:hypothetical protein
MPRLNPSPAARIRFDDYTGAIRSFFDPGALETPWNASISNSEISDEFLSANSDLLKLDGIDLILEAEKEGSAQTTCRYAQWHNNIPVYDAYLNVTLNRSDRRVISSVNRIQYGIPADIGRSENRIGPGDAVKILLGRYLAGYQEITHSEPELFIFENILVWRVEMDTLGPRDYLEVLIDAVDGIFVRVTDRRRFAISRPAKIFWPDPITSSQNPTLHWGSPKAVLDGELVEATLENLDDPGTTPASLQGKWVRIKELEKPEVDLPQTASGFIYSATDRNLLSVMVYYYLDRVIEWLRSLGIPAFNEAMKGPVDADAQALKGEDNSHFVVPVRGPVYLAFGEGGTPDASDPGVIVHEFGHAIHYFLLGRMQASTGCEEGFNDFISCVFRDRFNVHGFDRANPFPWDNNPTVSWDPVRRCDAKFRFDDPSYENFGIYRKGTVYATALWNIYLAIGGNSDNQEERLKAANEIAGMYLDMLTAVGDTEPVIDLVNGLISSDKSRTGGRFEKEIRNAFIERGLGLPTPATPILS